MHAAFERMCSNAETDTDSSDDELTMSPGVVKLAARCVREAAGVPAFERAVDQAHEGVVPEGLTVREAILLDGIGLYRELLETANLIEVGACRSLSGNIVGSGVSRSPEGSHRLQGPLDWQKTAFFDECSQLSVDIHEAPEAMGSIGCRSACPFGSGSRPGATPSLRSSSTWCAITSSPEMPQGKAERRWSPARHPLALYKRYRRAALADMGVIGSVQAQVPFHATDFGRQFISMARAVMDEPWSKDDLSDAVVPPFSGFEKADALKSSQEAAGEPPGRTRRVPGTATCEIRFVQPARRAGKRSGGRHTARRLRADRLQRRWKVCRMARRAAGSCRRAPFLHDRRAQGGRFDARVCERAAGCKGDGIVRNCGRAAEAGAHRVAITMQSAACQMGAGSCCQLILADLTSEDYPVAERDDSASTLFARIGLLPVETALARARRAFAALQGLPTGEMVCRAQTTQRLEWQSDVSGGRAAGAHRRLSGRRLVPRRPGRGVRPDRLVEGVHGPARRGIAVCERRGGKARGRAGYGDRGDICRRSRY